MSGMKIENAVDMLAERVALKVVEKLSLQGVSLPPKTVVVGSDYDASSCGVLARELGAGPLKASEVMFGLLDKKGEVGSIELGKALGTARTPIIAFVVTTPLKRISSRLGLAWPFDVDTGPDGRTLWRDRDGIAGRMVDAVRAEKKRRGI
jgi:hypothetical protein